MKKNRLLLIEDSEDDALLLKLTLEKEGFLLEILRVDHEEALRQALKSNQWDAVISDFALPGFDAFQALRLISADQNPPLPFLVVSGAVGEETAAQLMKQGAWDYISKENLCRLGPSLSKALEERKAAQEAEQIRVALSGHRRKHRLLFEKMTHGAAWCQIEPLENPKTFRFMELNSAFEKLMKLKEFPLAGKTLHESAFLSPLTQPEILEGIFSAAQGQKNFSQEVEWAETGRWFRLEAYPLEKGIFALLLEETTGQKKQYRQIARLSEAVNQSPVSVVMTDLEGNIEYVNPKFTEITGYTGKEAKGKNPSILQSGQVSREVYQELWNCLLQGKDWQGEFLNRKKNGDLYWEWAVISPIRDETGEIFQYVAVKQDITEKKQFEEKLRQSLEEKEILLQEIHHRVKNNLQIIIGLLDLQAAYISDPKDRDLFQDSQYRVKSMAMIHEKLYQSKNFSSIDMSEYLQSLGESIYTAYGGARKGIEIQWNLNPVFLDIHQAIPCGLMVNELLSNALKYAFIPGKPGKISISLRIDSKESKTILEVRDNGKGLPENFDPEKSTSLGLTLVSTLAQQIRGTLSFQGIQGTCARIVFPLPLKKD